MRYPSADVRRSLAISSLSPRVALLALTLSACSPARPARPSAPAPAPSCPRSTLALLPADATSTLFLRPRAIHTDPRLAPVVSRAYDAAAESALIHRAEQTGYDLRTVERAAIAWTPHGEVYVAAGPLDAVRVADLLWERLMSPRRRARDRASDQRLEGVLGETPVALLVAPVCAIAAYAEGADETRAVDRVLQPADGEDPDALLVWRTRQLPDAVAHTAGDALIHYVRESEVRVAADPGGLRVQLRLSGPLPDDAATRIRRALDALISSPLGEFAGAIQWLGPSQTELHADRESLALRVLVPWRALDALADGLRGRVGSDRLE